jgi:choline transport protein
MCKFGASSLAVVSSEGIIEIYALTHEGFETKPWHVFICYLLVIWLCCAVLLFGNKFLPLINTALMLLVIGGWIITIIIVGVMAGQPPRSHATNSFVWTEWQNLTGYKSNGLVFVLGMLNGSFAIGTPDCSTHMAEETPRYVLQCVLRKLRFADINDRADKYVPWAMHIQMVSSFLSTLIYLIVLFYGISSFDDVIDSTSTFYLLEMYRQATGTKAGAIGLSLLVIIPVIGSALGSMLTASRVFWSLARDKAVPCHETFAHVSTKWKNPFAAVLFTGCFATIMGCIYVGSVIAFEGTRLTFPLNT